MIKSNYAQGEYRSRIMNFANPKKIEKKYKNKRGSSYDELKENRIELNETEPISSIITQIQQQHQVPSSNERCFSYSPKESQVDKLLPPQLKEHFNKKTLVLDLDETLVHSGFKPFNPSDIILQIQFEGVMHEIHVLVRPGVEEFLRRMSELYEIVIFTASLSKYANPLLDILDPNGYCVHRLFREHCTMINNVFVKDLKRLNRDLKDNSPMSYVFNQESGFPIESWYFDKSDADLNKIVPILEFLSKVNDIRKYLPQMVDNQKIDHTKADNIINDYYNQYLLKNKKGDKGKNDRPESNRIENSLNDESKGININIVTNNYTNYFISNNNLNTKNSPSAKDANRIKSLNLFRNSGNNNTNKTNDNNNINNNDSYIMSFEPKTSKNVVGISIKSLDKANNLLSQSISSNNQRGSKYSSLLDKRTQAQLPKSNQTAQINSNSFSINNNCHNQQLLQQKQVKEQLYKKTKKQLIKKQLNKTPPLQVLIMPSSVPSSFTSNVSLMRPSSTNNLHSISFNKKKKNNSINYYSNSNSNSNSNINIINNNNNDITNNQFPRPKSSANIITGFIAKTPKMPIKKKVMTTPLDDIFIKRRLSSTSRHKKLKPSFNFQHSNLVKKEAQIG